MYAVGKRAIASYLTVPVYAAFHEWLGRGDELADLWRLWKEGDRKAAAASIPNEVVDELLVWGKPEQCREHIQRYIDNGVTTPGARALLRSRRASRPCSARCGGKRRSFRRFAEPHDRGSRAGGPINGGNPHA